MLANPQAVAAQEVPAFALPTEAGQFSTIQAGRSADASLHTRPAATEPGASDALRYRIQHELGWSVTVPEHREQVDLDSPAP